MNIYDDFKIKAQDGSEVSLADYRGESPPHCEHGHRLRIHAAV